MSKGLGYKNLALSMEYLEGHRVTVGLLDWSVEWRDLFGSQQLQPALSVVLAHQLAKTPSRHCLFGLQLQPYRPHIANDPRERPGRNVHLLPG